MTGLALLLLLVAPVRPFLFYAGDYVVEELRDENATTSPPFSISSVVPVDGGLRLFLITNRPDAVAALLADGAVEAQLSNHESETTMTVSLSLGVAFSCRTGADPVYRDYSGTPPMCGRKPPASIEYFFEVSVTLGPARDLAISQDPHFLWLIEER